ncbi:hypothetical protein FQR65_LT20577 [Abscondita terminalis]|nr:hypothetical protein FQR65_LT20577 [Abscondita terminalis]
MSCSGLACTGALQPAEGGAEAYSSRSVIGSSSERWRSCAALFGISRRHFCGIGLGRSADDWPVPTEKHPVHDGADSQLLAVAGERVSSGGTSDAQCIRVWLPGGFAVVSELGMLTHSQRGSECLRPEDGWKGVSTFQRETRECLSALAGTVLLGPAQRWRDTEEPTVFGWEHRSRASRHAGACSEAAD